MELYAIKDCKAVNFNVQLMPYINKFAAMRDVSTLVNTSEKSLLYMYPADFELYKLGSIDEKTGLLTSDIEFVINLQELKTTHEAA